MKKYLFLLISLLFACQGYAKSYNEAFKNVVTVAKELNSVSPLSIGNGLMMKEVGFNKNNKVFKYVIGIDSEFLPDLDNMGTNRDEMARNIISNWITSNNILKEFCQDIVTINGSVDVHFLNLSTLQEQVVNISSAQIKDVLNSNISAAQASQNQLQTMIKNETKLIGTEISPGMIMKDIRDTGNSVEFLIELDEDIYSIAILQNNLSPETVKGIAEELIADPLGLLEVKCYSENGRGITYTYVGNKSGKKATATVDAKTLYNLTH